MMGLFHPFQPKEGLWLAHCVGVLGSAGGYNLADRRADVEVEKSLPAIWE